MTNQTSTSLKPVDTIPIQSEDPPRNEIERFTPSRMGNLLTFAEGLLKSGFLPAAIRTKEQAAAIILTGQELDLPPMLSLREVNVIQGKPTLSAQLMLTLAYTRIPGFRMNVIESTDTRCVMEFIRPGQKPYQHEFTSQDAEALKLLDKDNWKKQRKTMLRWRCAASGLRVTAPDAIAGFYTAEEINPDLEVNYQTGGLAEGEVVKTSVTTLADDLMPKRVDAKPATEPVQNGEIKSEEFITRDERMDLVNLCESFGISKDRFLAYLSDTYQIHTTAEIKRSAFEAIRAWIRNGGETI